MDVPDPLEGKFNVWKNGCWIWKRAKQSKGYGSVGYQGVIWLAHRLAYTLLVGPIPEGRSLRHTCANPRCINPEHMEPITPGELALRSDSPWAQNAVKTHCPKGHPYTPENTRVRRGQRQCRECERAYNRRRWAAQKAAGKP